MSTISPTTAEITADVLRALKSTGVDTDAIAGDTEVRTPITGEVILSVRGHSSDDIDAAITAAAEAFATWRDVPAPVRGRLVKRWGELLTEHKEDLATLVTAEVTRCLARRSRTSGPSSARAKPTASKPRRSASSRMSARASVTRGRDRAARPGRGSRRRRSAPSCPR